MEQIEWKPRSKSEENRDGGYESKPRFGSDDDRGARGGDGYERKPRFGHDAENAGDGRKPRFDRDANDNQAGGVDRKPRFSKSFDNDNSSERKPRFNKGVDDESDGDFDPSSSSSKRGDDEERTERRPRFVRRSENQDGGDRPRFNRDNDGDRRIERTPRFSRDNAGDQRGGFDSKPRFSKSHGSENSYDRKPRFSGESDSDRGFKPRFDRDSDRGERSSWKPRSSERSHGDYDDRKRIATKFKPKPTYQVNSQDRVEKVDDGTIRLNKYVANAGVCSRREADELIQEGKVKVNGQVVTTLGTKVLITDTVTYKGKTLIPEKKVYVLMNKPKDCVTTRDDPEARRTVFDMLQGACAEQLHAVGRLDRNTTGVLLLTNDGELTQKLTHPKFNKRKIYQVWLDRNISESDFQQISSGVNLEDGFVKPDELSFVEPGDKTQVGIEIHSGQNRVVRRIFEHFEYKVQKLDRVYFAGLTKKSLPRGEWRYLTDEEVSILQRISSK